MDYAFTVFTPTYNRAHTLPRVWESLRQQTFRDFEWIIVDDESSDNTAEVVAGFAAQAKFPVVYLWQRHGHKKAASNHAVRGARGHLFLTLDSDDECVPTAIERLWWHWCNIPEAERVKFSAVTALCADPDGNVIGNRFPCDEWMDSDSIEMFHRFKVRGEKWGFQRTEVMREFPFPVVDGFVPEGVVWTQISQHYKTRFINEVLRVYHQTPDGLTHSRPPRQTSARGHAYWMDSVFRHEIRYFRYNPRWFVRSAINFTRFNLHCKYSPWRRARSFSPATRALLMALYPAGRLAYLVDRRRDRKR